MSGTFARSSTTTLENDIRRERRAHGRRRARSRGVCDGAAFGRTLGRQIASAGARCSRWCMRSAFAYACRLGALVGVESSQVTMLLSGMTDTAQVDENSSLADLALPNSMTANQLDTIARVLMEFEKSNRVPARDAAIACRALKASISLDVLPPTTQAMRTAGLRGCLNTLRRARCAQASQVGEQLRQMRQMRAALPAAHRYSRASRRCAPTFPAWSRDGGA